ncbi:fis bacterial regulatory protein hth signature [Lucifera butyrica]|uniref:Fis bacterial regulatory protein hth signature n=1 Tax=Lucifera butyrica TaxID=1351585 RepID=A0A498RBP9_9FIRM|nr:sigma 54-interacting transcriptional regulator [Lucifera butyrica]VBB08323.1 fis bacterial regulatory protein hth signature [Lucifera butyrica]VBB08395.1 fis bacterial regulatory protein hth signature [Lucifera butyrica]
MRADNIMNQDILNMVLAAVDSIHDGIVIVDKNSKIIYINAAYSEILNVKKDKVLNRFVSEIEPGAIILDSLKEKKPKINTVTKVKTRGKEILVNINPIIIDGELLGAVSIFKDVTEVYLLNKELEQVRKLTGYFYNDSTKFHKDLPESFSKIIGDDEKFINCLKLASIVAPTEATVLIEGESGAGKEVIVNAILGESKRNHPFVNINCSAIPENLFESELFGYSSGSFTGAKKGGKAGKFETANNGTIFLDEIGEMPLFMQAKLLRVLQSGEIQKVGSNNIDIVNVRVIAATNRNLKSMVREGTFREDLYFRLNTFKITIPPLRERGKDVILLAEHFLSLYCEKYCKKIVLSNEVKDLLLNNQWIGNVRQVQSCIEYAVIVCQKDKIQVENLPDEIRNPNIPDGKKIIKHNGKVLKNMIFDVEKAQIIKELQNTHGNKTRAMENIGISRRTFYRKLKLYDINPALYTK